MRLRYLVEYAVQDPARPRIRPAGVWITGDRTVGLDVSYQYLPGYEALEREAGETVQRLVERGQGLPDEYLQYLRGSLSPYRGVRGPVYITEEYGSHDALAAAVLAAARTGADLPGHEERPIDTA